MLLVLLLCFQNVANIAETIKCDFQSVAIVAEL